MKRLLLFCVFMMTSLLQGWTQARTLPHQFIFTLDSLYKEGLIRTRSQINQLQQLYDSLAEKAWHDSSFIKTAQTAAWEIYQGNPDSPWVAYDAISPVKKQVAQQKFFKKLQEVKDAQSLSYFLDELEPNDPVYLSLRNAYRQYHHLAWASNSKKYRDTASWLWQSVNMHRWIAHFQFKQYVVVNIAAAELIYYEMDKPILSMKTIVGKSATTSPRFAAWMERLILYPYWYVPSSIAQEEFLPEIKKDLTWFDQHNMQVVDNNGNVIDPRQLDWNQFHTGYFPYTIRQSTGCDNALGVLKFDLDTPFGVYLHDTNSKASFLSSHRFLSHGCIRLEEPVLLGNRLLENKLDTAFLQSCYLDQKPVYQELRSPVPVFCVYLLASGNEDGSVQFHQDIYRLFQTKKQKR